MKTIVIAGAKSGIGKTSLAEKLLCRLPDWSALKVTVKRGTACPRQQSKCNACRELKKDFEIVEDEEIINQKGTDTARLKEAGAKKVIWLKSTLKGLETGLEGALRGLNGSKGVVIEGTSVVKYIKPDLLIFIKDDSENLRSGAREAFEKADVIIDVSE